MRTTCVEFPAANQVQLTELELREPGNREVSIKIKYTLISAGTEKAIFTGQPKTGGKFPRRVGYCAAGTVSKVGSKVTEFTPGDRVFAVYAGHSAYATRPVSQVVKVPDNVSLEDAVFTRMAQFPLLSLRRAKLEIGSPTVVVGLGVVGLFAVQLAKIGGASPVIAIGNRPVRRELAASMGANLVLDPADPNLVTKVRGGVEAYGLTGPEVIIETSGSQSAFAKALNYSVLRSRIALCGANWGIPEPTDLYKVFHKGLEVIGAHARSSMAHNSVPNNWTQKKDWIAILNLMSDRRLVTHPMRSEIVDAATAPEVFKRLAVDRQFPLGMVFDWEQYW